MMARAVVPLSFEALPHLPGAAFTRTRLLTGALGAWGRKRSLSLPGVGAIHLEVQRMRVDPWRAEPVHPACVWGVCHGPHQGRIILDTALALHIARAALGAPPPRTLQPPSRGERGVLAAVLAAVLSRLGIDAHVDPGSASAASRDALAVDVLVSLPEHHGTATIEVPDGWSLATARLTPASCPSDLPFTLQIALARTTITAEEWATLAIGDAVVFEGQPPPATGAWSCELNLGDFAGRGSLSNADLRLTDPFALVARRARMPDPKDVAIPAVSAHAPAALLAGAPVEVTLELGRLTIGAAELAGLVEGAVLPVGPRRREPVTLVVGDQPWARGELVTVEDQLGVRVTEIFPRR